MDFGVHFGVEKSRKSAPKRGPENEPEKEQIRGAEGGPILLPSVAPEGTPPAVLLKKLAFGKNWS